ncbi:MAG: TAXI family TRAP transporter solute-binding subunit [Candidatus Competibacterales bacterium]|nr:TAXI family TRAP transporter solute-binding subunit [Candidatus Competibacterales bacterium]
MSRNDVLRIWLPAVLIAVAGLALTYVYLVGPAPPRTVVLATASESGAYHAFGERYRAIFEQAGFELELRTTAGSVENLDLMRDPDSGIDLAFVQGGVADPADRAADSTQLQGLASVFREPLWIFYRTDTPATILPELLKGRPAPDGGDIPLRVAVGGSGSGTRAIAEQVLRINGITGEAVERIELGGAAAATALIEGAVDVALFVIAPEPGSYIYTHLIRAMRTGSAPIRLMNFARSESYARRLPFLSSLILPQGLLDLQHDIPAADIELIAPTATLVARRELHPAIVYLMMEALTEVHAPGSLLDPPNEFPSPRYLDFPLSPQAERYLASGPSFLYQVLPFGLAASLDRLKVMLLPLLTLVLPLSRAAPPAYRWRIRSRIYRWYTVLREADQKASTAADVTALRAQLAKIDAIEHDLPTIAVPLSYMEEFYNLRLHIGYIRDRLEKAIEQQQSRG